MSMHVWYTAYHRMPCLSASFPLLWSEWLSRAPSLQARHSRADECDVYGECAVCVCGCTPLCCPSMVSKEYAASQYDSTKGSRMVWRKLRCSRLSTEAFT